MLPPDRRAVHRIGFVAVDAPEFDWGAVERHDAAGYADLTEPHPFADEFPVCFHKQRIQIWRFRVPKEYRTDLHTGFCASVRIIHQCLYRQDRRVRNGVSSDARRIIIQLQTDRDGLPGEGKKDLQLRRTQILRELGCDHIIYDVLLRTPDQIDIPDNPGKPEFILILHVGTVTPFQDKDSQCVFPFLQEAGYIKY